MRSKDSQGISLPITKPELNSPFRIHMVQRADFHKSFSDLCTHTVASMHKQTCFKVLIGSSKDVRKLESYRLLLRGNNKSCF